MIVVYHTLKINHFFKVDQLCKSTTRSDPFFFPSKDIAFILDLYQIKTVLANQIILNAPCTFQCKRNETIEKFFKLYL